ncbi:hypothetical protein NPM_3643 [Nostoc sp. 'Peltigera membranacea cyanobiont' N6]|nr:hypothetical protein NPM_3643 [Nostoc sp. 'Peltigera membranacea cyanobiont' N6]
MANIAKDINNFPEVHQVSQSKYLKTYIMNRMHSLNLYSFLSEEDVLQYVMKCLIETLESGEQINNPIAWSKLVSEQHINKTYKRHRAILMQKLVEKLSSWAGLVC